jgi:NADH-quinone oxidoreductase subunit F
MTISSSIAAFRDEYVAHVKGHGCPMDPRATALFTVPAKKKGARA